MKRKIDLNCIDDFIELITDLVFIKSIDGTYLYCNNLYCEFLKKDKNNIIGKDDYDLLPKENALKCCQDDKKALNSTQIIETEDTFYLEDEINYFKTTKQKLYDNNGSLIGILSIAKDITENKQYQLIYEDNNELLEYINHETDINKILTKIVKLSEKRNTNLKCSILLLDESKNHLCIGSAPSLPSFYNNAINGVEIGEKVGSCGAATFKKERVIVENINTHPNWQPYLKLTQKANLYSCWSEPIFSTNNDILGTFAMYSNKPSKPTDFQLKLISSYAHLAAVTIEKENKKIEADIKKRKQLEKDLLEKTDDLQLFKQVVENISYGITITKADKDNKLVYVNKAFEHITGYNKTEALGLNCNFLQNHDKQQKAIDIIKHGLDNNKKTQVELRNYKKDGTLFYNLVNISPVYDQNKNVTHYVGIQKDITQDKKQEALLSEQSKLASMGEMIGNIAHQWRQPLSVISTAATGMQIQKEFDLLEDEEFDKACNAINENVQYLSQTIDDFKNFIKNDSIKKYFSLTHSVEKFLSLVSGTIKNNNIEVILDLDDTIQINGFENELIQCYMNIFNNAKDALINQQEQLIIIKTLVKGKKAVISIKDNAGGIHLNIINKIFEPYFTTKHKFQGTGLGLHMTYNLIVDGMKGDIKVKNTNFNNKAKNFTGAEFIITLPIS